MFPPPPLTMYILRKQEKKIGISDFCIKRPPGTQLNQLCYQYSTPSSEAPNSPSSIDSIAVIAEQVVGPGRDEWGGVGVQ